MIENLEQLKKAIEIEIQYKYIDIHGKTQAFSSFIKNEAKKYYKLSKKNPKWAVLVETFEHYPFANVNERRRSIDSLIKVLKSETSPKQTASSKICKIKGLLKIQMLCTSRESVLK